jgi:hypothetical protein
MTSPTSGPTSGPFEASLPVTNVRADSERTKNEENNVIPTTPGKNASDDQIVENGQKHAALNNTLGAVAKGLSKARMHFGVILGVLGKSAAGLTAVAVAAPTGLAALVGASLAYGGSRVALQGHEAAIRNGAKGARFTGIATGCIASVLLIPVSLTAKCIEGAGKMLINPEKNMDKLPKTYQLFDKSFETHVVAIFTATKKENAKQGIRNSSIFGRVFNELEAIANVPTKSKSEAAPIGDIIKSIKNLFVKDSEEIKKGGVTFQVVVSEGNYYLPFSDKQTSEGKKGITVSFGEAENSLLINEKPADNYGAATLGAARELLELVTKINRPHMGTMENWIKDAYDKLQKAIEADSSSQDASANPSQEDI